MFAVSDKDMAEDPRFTFKPKKDGSPSYFQKAGKGMESLDKHGYIVSVPTLSFKVLGEPMRSATEFRSNFAKSDDDMQEQMITDLFGSYNPEIHELMKAKITEHSISDLHTKYSMEAAGAGIVTKQNATKDVPVGGEFDNVKKLGLSSKKKKPFISRMEAVIKEVQLLKQDKTLTFEDSNKINAKLEQLKSVVQIHNNTAIVESLYTLDREDIMNSEVLVQGVGRYTIKSLMANVHSKLKDLASKASTLTNGGMPSDFKDIKSHLDSGIVQLMVSSLETAFDDIEKKRRAGGKQSQGIPKNVFDSFETDLRESWTRKQKRK